MEILTFRAAKVTIEIEVAQPPVKEKSSFQTLLFMEFSL